jgi:hypothetical protein
MGGPYRNGRAAAKERYCRIDAALRDVDELTMRMNRKIIAYRNLQSQ